MDRRYEFVRASTSRVVIDEGVEGLLPHLVRELEPDGVVVLHDAQLPELAGRIARSLEAKARLSIPGGEASKRLAVVGDLARNVRLAGATRNTVLVAVGGGTITDLVGMLAAILLRGVPFVSCPTTTLAMCDAALGGRNGVDHCGLPNDLGAVHHAHLIAADVEWLRTLPDEQFREGLIGAVLKAAVLDPERFARLEQLAPDLGQRRPKAVVEAVDMAVAMTMALVQSGEQRRRWLDFGHTVGQALEGLAGGRLRRGTCVGLGMLVECRAAGVAEEITRRLATLLGALGLPKTIPPACANASSLWRLARSDQKARHGSVSMCVPRALGDCVEVELTEAALSTALRAFAQQSAAQ
ncbi:MAG TPA: 3-dehydroquinate synthase family protein [Planctomycetota bacterium]|nr:3-dehydroquinate synthase family protein [Planctomycetota bacterium]